LSITIAMSTTATTARSARTLGLVIRFSMTDSFRAARGRQRVPFALAHAGAEIDNLFGGTRAATIRFAQPLSSAEWIDWAIDPSFYFRDTSKVAWQLSATFCSAAP